MNCPTCDGDSKIMDTVNNSKDGEVYRKRKCLKCGFIFYTVEFEAVINKRYKRDWYIYHRGSGYKHG